MYFNSLFCKKINYPTEFIQVYVIFVTCAHCPRPVRLSLRERAHVSPPTDVIPVRTNLPPRFLEVRFYCIGHYPEGVRYFKPVLELLKTSLNPIKF